jgi:hypothetical protein
MLNDNYYYEDIPIQNAIGKKVTRILLLSTSNHDQLIVELEGGEYFLAYSEPPINSQSNLNLSSRLHKGPERVISTATKIKKVIE